MLSTESTPSILRAACSREYIDLLQRTQADFINYKKELPEQFLEFEVAPFYFDFWKISMWQLQLAGVLPHHIEIASKCTYSDSDNFFSYRREGVTGRNATMIWLRDK